VFDFVVAGAGIVGVNVAAVLRQRLPAARILVVDKEAVLGEHASGRNSGVLHAGFYYAPGSLKAQMTRRGNVFLTDYCTRHGLPLRPCGKLVVAQGESDLAGLDMLFQRGTANGVPLEEVRAHTPCRPLRCACGTPQSTLHPPSIVLRRQVTAEQASRIEPLARTHHRALWSPTTAVSDPVAVLQHQAGALAASGATIRLGTRVTGATLRSGHVAVALESATDGPSVVEAGHFINAAGLYADRLAHAMGFGLSYRLLPFVGLYMYVSDLPLQALLYPVPSMDRPFLGVHFTVTASGRVKIGPTAIPALWREQYPRERGSWRRFSAAEMVQTLSTQAAMAARDGGFRRLAWEEVRKYGRTAMAAGAGALLRDGLQPAQLGQWGRAGIRAQLVRLPAPDAVDRTPRLEMDYVVEGSGVGGAVTHVLNAVSPGWTSARPFAQHVVDTWVLGPPPETAA